MNVDDLKKKCLEAIGDYNVSIDFRRDSVEIEIFYDEAVYGNEEKYELVKKSLIGCVYLDDDFGYEDALKDIVSEDFVETMCAGYVSSRTDEILKEKDLGKFVPPLHIVLEDMEETVSYIETIMTDIREGLKI